MTVQVVRRAFDLTPPATPTNASATSPNAFLNTFSWTHTTTGDFSNFWIERSYDGVNWGFLRTYTVTGVNFSINDNTFVAGNRIWYRVASQDVRGNKSAYTTGVSTQYDNPITTGVGIQNYSGFAPSFVFANRLVLTNALVVVVSSGVAAIGMNSNGDMTTTTNVENAQSWHRGQPITGIGNSYEVRFQTIGGSLLSANADVWLPLTSTRTFTVSGGTQFQGNLQIRDTTESVIRISALTILNSLS